MSLKSDRRVQLAVRFIAGATLALGVALAGLWPVGRGSQGPGPNIGLDFHRPGQIVRVETGPAGDLFMWRNGGLQCYQPDGGLRWESALPVEAAGLPALSLLEMAGAPDGSLYLVGVLDETREQGVYRVDPEGEMEVFSILPNLSPADIAVGPDGVVFVLSLATPRMNRVLVGSDTTPAEFAEPWVYQLGASGQVVRSLDPQSYRLHSGEEAFQAVEAFHDQRLAIGPDGWIYVYSRSGGAVARVDPETGRRAGVTHLIWSGFPSQVRVDNFQFAGEREVIYSLVELGEYGTVTGSQSWLLDLEGAGRKLLHHSLGQPGQIWQAHLNPLTRRLMLVDVLDDGRGGMLEVELENQRSPLSFQ